MRNLCTQITVVLLLVVGVASADAPPMQSFTSTEGRFTVQFPGTPKQQTEPLSLGGGGSSTLYQYWVEMDDSNISYMVMYNDYPADYATGSPQDVLAATRDGATKDKTVTSDVEISLSGVPGRAFTCKDKDWSYVVHQFLKGKRLYQLIVVSNPDHPATMTEQFLNSFRIN